MKRIVISLVLVLVMVLSLTPAIQFPALAANDTPSVYDSDIIKELQETYFLPVVEDGTIINGGTPKGLIVLDVDTDTKYQVLKGFGASGCWVGPNCDQWTDEQIAKMLLMVYDDEIGINFIGYRHNIGGGSVGNLADKAETLCIEVAPGVYDTSVDAVNMSLLYRAAEAGASSIGLIYYTPPLRMTIAGVTSGHPEGGTNLKADCFDDYAEYVVGTAQAIEKAGIDVTYVSPFNEPAWGGTGYDPSVASQEHCYYTPDEVYQITDLIANVMEDKNITSFGIGAAESPWWSLTDYTSGLFARYLENETIMKHLHHFCAHSYGNTAKQKENISDIFLQHPEVPLHQTEECRQNRAFYSYEFLETNRMAMLLHEDFTILNISEWDFWCITDSENRDEFGMGGSLTEVTSDGQVNFPKRFFVAGQYSKFVTGHTRVELSMPESDTLFGTAYLSPDGKTTTLVINNYGTEGALVSFNGLEGQMAKAYQTSDEYNLQYIGDVDATYGYEFPAMSVTTLVFENSNATGAFGDPTNEEAKPDDSNTGTNIPEGAETVKVDIPIGSKFSLFPRINKMVKGGDFTFTVAARGGYALESVTVNGEEVEVDKNGKVTLTNVTEDIEIKVNTFESGEYLLYTLLDFENFEAGTDLIGTNGIQYTNSWGTKKFNIQAHKNTIHSGQSLLFKYNVKASPESANFSLTEDYGFTNWGGVQDIWVYVDTSMTSGQPSFQVSFTAQYFDDDMNATGEYNLFSLKSNGDHQKEFTYQIMNADGEWETTDSTRWGRCLLPEKYVGWVRIPMGAFQTDIAGRTTANLFNVIRVSVGFDISACETPITTPVFVDTVALSMDPAATNYRAEGRPVDYLIVNEQGELIGSSDDIQDPEPTDPSEPTNAVDPTAPTDAPDNQRNSISPTTIIIILLLVITAIAVVAIILMPGKPKAKPDDSSKET